MLIWRGQNFMTSVLHTRGQQGFKLMIMGLPIFKVWTKNQRFHMDWPSYILKADFLNIK